ncbi:hypothetical protein F5Y11DRAFT_329268 [Daldinia sp. FL1419]|nr:hypothetical protein F5Y11DRAFT_329268 [Daldinia sp. FL1419]
MSKSTVASLAGAVYILCFASFISTVSAQSATTSPMPNLPEDYEDFIIGLSLSSASGPEPAAYRVAPLTKEAGLDQTNKNALRTIDVQGRMVIVDQGNYNKLDESIKDSVAYISCDATTNDSYIDPSDVLNAVMKERPQAILLYSTSEGNCCSLGGDTNSYTSVWTMTTQSDAWEVKNQTVESTVIRAEILGNDDGGPTGDQTQGGNNSAVAMSILYSITGLITLLFLIIIATGAIRAHRHPERYGPRASYGGRPRQSRARGLARAVLETLPIVKFGDPQPAKPDPENELESISGDRQQHSSPTQRDLALSNAEQGGSSPDATAVATSNLTTQSPGVGTSGNNRANDVVTEDNHLGCSICTEDFTVGQDVRVLPCDHKFHPQCIDPWLVNVSGTCPLCRLDLRPHAEGEEDGEGNWPSVHPDAAGGGPIDSHLAPMPESDVDATQRRRRSRLLDWNRLRHATVDERIQALRQYRQTQVATSSNSSAEDQNRHAKLSDRLREKFHIRTRAHPPSDPPSTSQ